MGSTGGKSRPLFLAAVRVRPRRWPDRIQAEHLKRQVRLRRRAYSELTALLKAAMTEGRTVRQIATRLSRAAGHSPQSALLLCDLYEVLQGVEEWIRYNPPPEKRTLDELVRALERQSFSGEAILF